MVRLVPPDRLVRLVRTDRSGQWVLQGCKVLRGFKGSPAQPALQG